MKIGDLVNNQNKNRLFCGSGMYPHAVVMSLNPFILVSEGTDMKWSGLTEKEVPIVLGKASIFTVFSCLRRLTGKEKVSFIKQLVGVTK